MNRENLIERFKTYATVLATGLGLAFVTLPFAGLAEPEPGAPVIYLADNLDEADGLGWCIDTLGRGFAESLQAHSCKPQGGDTQFDYDRATLQIRSVPFADKCMTYAAPDNGAVPFALLDCDPANGDQQFLFNPETGRITLNSAPDQCVVVGAQSRTAGPFMSRDLTLTPCAEAEAALATWIYKPS